jgi:hypothetical protein
MRNPDDDRLTRIVDAAIEGSDPGGLTASEAMKLEQHTQLANALKLGFQDAPQQVIDAAKALMPKRERIQLPLKVLARPLGLMGARLESGQDTQVLLEAGGSRLRVMYSRTPKTIMILGHIDSPGWSVECGGSDKECGADGRFEFEVQNVESSGLTLRSDSAEFIVPSLEELDGGIEDLD